MGLNVEFNWYLVLNNPSEKIEDGPIDPDTFQQIITDEYYRTHKEGARLYPVGSVVPVIENDICTGLAYIRECSQRLDARNQTMTVIDYEYINTFQENDPVLLHYTDMYLAYKKKQEIEDHGGKFKLQDYVNALERRRFEEAIQQLEGESK